MILAIFFFLLLNYSAALFGGRYAMQSEVTSMATVRSHRYNSPNGMISFCGGALISENTVLTSAHCVYNEGQFAMVVDVVVNDYDMYTTESHESARQTKAIDMLPDYTRTLDVQDDLAILYLPSPVDYCSEYGAATVARLPPSTLSQLLPVDPLQTYYNSPLTDQEVFTLSFCSLTSWGIVESGNFSHVPMNLAVSLKKSDEPNSFIATAPYGRFCVGDSGAPVFCTIRGMQYLVGIVAEIGLFDQSNISEVDKMTVVEKCAAFDHAKIVDVRARMPLIHAIMKRRGMQEYLAKGQRKCKYN